MRHATGMARRAAAGKARHREVETAPEEMHRARLAQKSSAELLEHPVGARENPEKAPHGVAIIGGVSIVVRESDWIRQFIRHLVDDRVDAKFGKRRHDQGVEARDGLTRKRKLPPRAVAGQYPQGMVDEIELDLEMARAVGNRRGRQPPRVHIKRDMPGMVQPWRA